MVYQLFNPDMKKRALQLLEDGWEIPEIADALGVSTKIIPHWHNCRYFSFSFIAIFTFFSSLSERLHQAPPLITHLFTFPFYYHEPCSPDGHLATSTHFFFICKRTSYTLDTSVFVLPLRYKFLRYMTVTIFTHL